MKKPLCGNLKHFLILPHLQGVRGSNCEPSGFLAVAGNTSLAVCT